MAQALEISVSAAQTLVTNFLFRIGNHNILSQVNSTCEANPEPCISPMPSPQKFRNKIFLYIASFMNLNHKLQATKSIMCY